MKKSIGIVSALAVILAVSGFGLAEVFEYLQVARKNVSEAVKESIPVDVEIDRMEVLLSNLDQQVDRQKHHVAKGQIAVENAERRLAADRLQATSTLAKMRQLRELQKCEPTPCGYVQIGTYRVAHQEVSHALVAKLNTYKAQTSIIAEKEKVVAAQRQACAVLTAKFGEWNQQRELLTSRLESLHSRHQAQRAGRKLAADTSFGSSELNRAALLANEIEARLSVAEKAETLENGSLDHLLGTTAEAEPDVTAEVDRLLGKDRPSLADNNRH